jgi:hypothetical protein
MEFKEWMVKNQNWFIYPIIIIISYWGFSMVDKREKKINSESISTNEVIIQTPVETFTKPKVLTQEEVEENKKKELKRENKRKFENDRERVTGCLIGSFDGAWGTYSFSSNGVFSWEVNSGPYRQYREGTWKFIGGNKVKLNKTWISKSGTITISKYCEVFGLDSF